MVKIKFRALFEEELRKQKIEVVTEKVTSAIEKTARHMRNRDGFVEWDESEIDNAVAFYHEFKQKNTFNREIAKHNRKTN